MFYEQYRPGLQFTVWQLSRHVRAPGTCHLVALKRCIRYLAGTMDDTLALRSTCGDIPLNAHSDANWAGLADRKSVSGAVIYINGALVMSFSRTHNTRATSSCESELYALGTSSTETLWISGLLKEAFHIEAKPTICGDSSSAITLASRAGMGKLKHVEIRLLAIHHWSSSGHLALAKIGTDDNTGDLARKSLSAYKTARFGELVGM